MFDGFWRDPVRCNLKCVFGICSRELFRCSNSRKRYGKEIPNELYVRLIIYFDFKYKKKPSFFM